MHRSLAFPSTTASFVVTGSDYTSLDEVKAGGPHSSFLDDNGAPNSHPSLPDGHVLVAELRSSDILTAWVCNNLPTMRTLHGRIASGHAREIRWYIGHVSLVNIRPVEAGTLWDGGYDDYLVDTTTRRPLTPDELDMVNADPGYPVVKGWLRSSCSASLSLDEDDRTVVRILERLRSGD